MSRDNERRREIEAIREDAEEAFRAGRDIQTVPRAFIGTANRSVWEGAWRDAEFQAEQAKVHTLRDKVEQAETVDDLKAVLRDLMDHLNI